MPGGLFKLSLMAALAATASAIAIMGVDFGSEFMKVSVVKPGMPFQVVANFQSKRKTPAMVSFYAGERGFGADAEALLGRKPQLVVISPQSLLGRNSSHSLAEAYLQGRYYSTPTEVNERGGLDYILTEPGRDVQRFSAEESSAMLLAHARDYASSVAGQKIVDAVLTVPSFYTQSERLALITAAELAGLKVLSLVDENTAAGIHYGIDRTYGAPNADGTPTKPHLMAIYNMGAEATQVTVFQYDSYTITEKGSSKNKTIGQATVLAKAWDTSLGGHAFDLALMNLVSEAFNADKNKAKHIPASANGDIRKVTQAMAKMRKSVVKTKEILSANEEYGLTVEGLLPDVDFRLQLSRTKLEQLAAETGLTKKIIAVAEEALKNAGISLPALDVLEIVGGGVRMPLVQKTLRDWLTAGGAGASLKDANANAAASSEKPATDDKEKEKDAHIQGGPLGQHLNGDEAMALGAAFLAANRSSAFRVRKVGMVDAHPFGVGVRVSHLPLATAAAAPVDASATAKPWSKRSSLFRAGNALDSAKRISFATDKDLRAVLFYELPESNNSNGTAASFSTGLAPAGTSKNVAAFNVTGIAALVEEQSKKEAERLQSMKEEGLELPAAALASLNAASSSEDGADAAANGNGNAGGGALVLTPKVHLSFELDHSGIVRLSRAEAVFEITEREKEVIKVTPSASPSDEATPTPTPTPSSSSDEAADKEKEKEKEDASASATATASPSPAATTTVIYKAARRTIRFPLTVTDDSAADGVLPVKPLDKAGRTAALASLAKLAQIDEERHAKEQAKNSVEAAIYATREKLSNEEEALASSKVATDEQIEALREVLMATEDWLYDEGASTDVATYKGKLKAITDLSGPIFSRLQEHGGRPKLIEETKDLVSGSKLLLESFPKTHPQVTEEELKGAKEQIEAFDAWFTKAVAEQKALPAHETPILTRAAVDNKLRPLSDTLTKLSKKPKPTPTPKAAKKTATAEGDAKKADGEKAEGDAKKPAETEGEKPASKEEEAASSDKKEAAAEGEAKKADEQVEMTPETEKEEKKLEEEAEKMRKEETAEHKKEADEKEKATVEEDEDEPPASDADFAELEAEAAAAAAAAGKKDEL